MKTGALLIRADASLSIGTGHVMRCLALAEAWQDSGGDLSFATAEMPEPLERRLRSQGFRLVRIEAGPGSLEDAAETAALAEGFRAGWIVIDGDRFNSDFLANVRHNGARTLLIDDFASRSQCCADLIVNPNLGAETESYRVQGLNVPVLAGLRYVLLRREFQAIAEREFRAKGNRVLITLGGSDPENLTPRITKALAAFTNLELTVVAGAGYANTSELEQLNATHVKVVIDSQNMAKLMAAAEFAIIAAGGTLWELLSAGCAVLSYSRNRVQSRVVESLAKDEVIVDLGDTAHFDPHLLVAAVRKLTGSFSNRARMTSLGRALIDGRGAMRVVEALRRAGAH